eukprot:3936716-Rhodomonas_salina.1
MGERVSDSCPTSQAGEPSLAHGGLKVLRYFNRVLSRKPPVVTCANSDTLPSKRFKTFGCVVADASRNRWIVHRKSRASAAGERTTEHMRERALAPET